MRVEAIHIMPAVEGFVALAKDSHGYVYRYDDLMNYWVRMAMQEHPLNFWGRRCDEGRKVIAGKFTIKVRRIRNDATN